MTSKAQKAAGYLLPPVLDPPTRICVSFEIPDTDEYRRAVMGHIHQLGKWWNWEKSYTPNDTRAKEAAEVFRQALYETLRMGECGDGDLACCDDLIEEIQGIREQIKTISRRPPNLSITEQNTYITQYQSVVNNYVTNNGDVNVLAPDLGTPSATNDEIYCALARAIVDAACEAGILWNEEQAVWSNITAVGFGIATAVAAYFTLGASVLLGLGLAGAGAGIYSSGTGVATLILQDTAAREKVACCMKDGLKGQVPTKAVFAAALGGCGFAFGTNEAQIASVVSQFLQSDEVHAVFLEAGQQLQQQAALGLLAECPCPDPDVRIQLNVNGQPYSSIARTLPNQWRINYSLPTGSSGIPMCLNEVGFVNGNGGSMPDVTVEQAGTFPPYLAYGLPDVNPATPPINLLGKQYCYLTTYGNSFTGVFITSAPDTTLDLIVVP